MATGAPLLASHLDPVADGWQPADLDNFADRIGGWLTLVGGTTKELDTALNGQPTSALAVHLHTLAGAGLPINFNAADPQDLIAASRATLDSIIAAALPEQPPPPPGGNDRTAASTATWVATATQPVRALIGDGLPLLPILRLAGELADTLSAWRSPTMTRSTSASS